jgi:CheY-like chemotaxis protein
MTKVLIIEDEQNLLRLLHQTFTDAGFVVETAGDGHEGIRKTRAFVPEIILLDIILPKMDGLEFLDNIKADTQLKAIPVMILTNLLEADKKEVSVHKGAVSYHVKANTSMQAIVSKAKEILGISKELTQR